MTRRTKKTVQVVTALIVLALALPVANLVVGRPSGTALTAAGSASIAPVLERSCASCHVKGVAAPVYAGLPVARGLIQRDIRDGLDRVDLGAALAHGDAAVPEPVLAKIERQVTTGQMPPLRYLALHWSAGLGSDRARVLDWVRDARAAQAHPGVPEAFKGELIRPLPARLAYDPAKAALGQKLYNDKRLSGDDTVSCASCHDLAKGGTDHMVVSDGIRRQKGGINSPTTFNAALGFAQFWDGRAGTLEEQAAGPPMNPVEMGSAGWPQIVAKLNKDKALRAEFERVYPEGFSDKTITNAVAEFERTLVTPNSRFDRYLMGDQSALGPSEKHGYEVFRERGCATCHVGELLGGKSYELLGRHAGYFSARGTPMTQADEGRYNVTKDEADRHRFKVPTLRNVARTFPYFHDGSQKTLRQAVDAMAVYQTGGPLADQDARDLVNFLESLTGEYGGKAL